MFGFIIKYFGFLKSIPFFAILFDMQLKFWAVVTLSKIPGYLDDIEEEVSLWGDITVIMHKYGGMQFNHNGKELGHIHSNGLLDMPLSRKMKTELMHQGRISDHHTFKNTGWISFYIRTPDDRDYAERLLRLAWLKNEA